MKIWSLDIDGNCRDSLGCCQIDKKDPSASLTRKYIEDLQTVCKAELGSRRIFAIESRGGHEACLVCTSARASCGICHMFVSRRLFCWMPSMQYHSQCLPNGNNVLDAGVQGFALLVILVAMLLIVWR
jgi:hypothetical protein